MKIKDISNGCALFLTVYCFIEWLVIGHILVSVFLISLFNIFYYSKFIFFVKIGVCFLMNI